MREDVDVAMTDDEIIELSDYFIHEAFNFMEQEIARDRIRAQEYYDGQKFGNEMRGRSQVVSTDLRDAIEWTLPTLLRIFFSSDHVIELSPVGDEDIEPASFMTQLFDYILLRKNSGFMVFYTWFKDALMKRNGFVTAYWNMEERTEYTEYTSLTEPEYKLLTMDEAFEAEEIEEYKQTINLQIGPEQPPQPVEMVLYDVKGTYTYEESCLIIENIPPEELSTLETTKTVKSSEFWVRRTYQTIGSLRDQGFDVPDDVDGQPLEAETYSAEERRVRFRNRMQIDFDKDSDRAGIEELDPTLKMVYAYFMDVKADLNETGRSQWWRIVRIGEEIIEKHAIIYPQYATLTPVPRPHQLFGDGYYELVGKFQELKSSLHRILLDYIYYSTNPRAELARDKWDPEFTLSDWMNNAPNGAVRTREQGAVTPIYPAPLSPMMPALLEYFGETQRENAVGVTRHGQGQEVSGVGRTATGINQVMSAAASRIELIARVFAETGITELAKLVKDLLIEYPETTSKMVARLSNGKITNIDAQQLKGNYDFVVTVGTGNADQAQMLESLLALFGLWQKMIEMGAGPTAQKQLVTWQNLHQGLREFVKAAGLKNVSLYTHDPAAPLTPEEQPPPPQKSPQDIAAEMQAKFLAVEAQTKQKEVRIKEFEAQAKIQLEQQKLDLEWRIEQLKAEIARDKVMVDAVSKGVNDGKLESTPASATRKPSSATA